MQLVIDVANGLTSSQAKCVMYSSYDKDNSCCISHIEAGYFCEPFSFYCSNLVEVFVEAFDQRSQELYEYVKEKGMTYLRIFYAS